MPVKKGQIIEIDVQDMAFGGKGLARIDGMAVFVDQAVAGDRVAARIIRKRKQYAEARVLKLMTPSPDRIAAPCPYSGNCGGCKWQFLRYAKQLEYKRRHVADSLRHIGRLEDVNVHPTLPADPIFGYRNKMEFSCADRRWLLPAEMGRDDLDTSFALGLHVPGTFYKVLDTEACLLQPDLGTALVELLAYAADHLSYQQDAVANEAYLETARRRVSVRRHARLVDYRMHDGASARTQPQDPNTFFGSMLRLDVDSGDPYGIPADNPFVERAQRVALDQRIGLRAVQAGAYERRQQA